MKPFVRMLYVPVMRIIVTVELAPKPEISVGQFFVLVVDRYVVGLHGIIVFIVP